VSLWCLGILTMSSNSPSRLTLLEFALTGIRKVQAKHADALLVNLFACSKDSRPVTDPTEIESISLSFHYQRTSLHISSRSWGGDWSDIEVGEYAVGTARLDLEKGNLMDFEEVYESWVKENGGFMFSEVSLYAVLHPLWWDKPQYICTNRETGQRIGLEAAKEVQEDRVKGETQSEDEDSEIGLCQLEIDV